MVTQNKDAAGHSEGTQQLPLHNLPENAHAAIKEIRNKATYTAHDGGAVAVQKNHLPDNRAVETSNRTRTP